MIVKGGKYGRAQSHSYGAPTLRLYGCPVGKHDANWLVYRLRYEDNPDALTAASAIERAIDRENYAIALPPDERTAILAVLDDPPAGLVELRARLRRDLR